MIYMYISGLELRTKICFVKKLDCDMISVPDFMIIKSNKRYIFFMKSSIKL